MGKRLNSILLHYIFLQKQIISLHFAMIKRAEIHNSELMRMIYKHLLSLYRDDVVWCNDNDISENNTNSLKGPETEWLYQSEL